MGCDRLWGRTRGDGGFAEIRYEVVHRGMSIVCYRGEGLADRKDRVESFRSLGIDRETEAGLGHACGAL